MVKFKGESLFLGGRDHTLALRALTESAMEGGVRPPSGGGAAGGSDAGGAAHGNVPRLVAADDAFFHRESLGLSMQALREAGTFCDATVLVGGRTFHVHRVVIAGGSEVLAAMFTAGLREGKTQTAELPEVSPPFPN